jgi:hypothetical protein
VCDLYIIFAGQRVCFLTISCGHGIEYLPHIPAIRRRRWKRNPVPGAITGSFCSWGDINTGTWPYKLGSLECETVKCGHKSRGNRIWEWLRWRRPAEIVNSRPNFSSERTLHKDYNASVQLENKNSGSGSQGACRQTNWLAVNRQS